MYAMMRSLRKLSHVVAAEIMVAESYSSVLEPLEIGRYRAVLSFETGMDFGGGHEKTSLKTNVSREVETGAIDGFNIVSKRSPVKS